MHFKQNLIFSFYLFIVQKKVLQLKKWSKTILFIYRWRLLKSFTYASSPKKQIIFLIIYFLRMAKAVLIIFLHQKICTHFIYFQKENRVHAQLRLVSTKQ